MCEVEDIRREHDRLYGDYSIMTNEDRIDLLCKIADKIICNMEINAKVKEARKAETTTKQTT